MVLETTLTQLKGNKKLKSSKNSKHFKSTDGLQDVALIYVLAGTLLVSQNTADKQEEVHMFSAYSGEFVGGLAVLTAEPSFFTIRAKHSCRIALLSKNTVYRSVTIQSFHQPGILGKLRITWEIYVPRKKRELLVNVVGNRKNSIFKLF